MEPVSISIGAMALISLLTTCVECFEYIDAAKTCGRNLELLTTKFAIEKARLLIWGDSVGILSTNTTGKNKVESPYVRPIVEQILNCIRMLFEDTSALTAHYGLEPTHDDDLAINGPFASAGSPGLPLRLKASYIQFKSRVERKHNQTSTTKKTKWAIRDKSKFSSLVEEIHQFIDGLEAVTSSVEVATKRAALVREELSTVEDPEDLRLIAEASIGSNQQWSDAASVALEASVCGNSDCERIRDWMITASDARMSTVVDCAASQPSSDLPEASTIGFSTDLRPHPTGRPSPAYVNPSDWGKAGPGHCDFPPLLNHGDSKMLEFLPTWKEAFSATVNGRNRCFVCGKTFSRIGDCRRHQKIHEREAFCTWCCVVDACPFGKDRTWDRLDKYRDHCDRIHPDKDSAELVILQILKMNAALRRLCVARLCEGQ